MPEQRTATVVETRKLAPQVRELILQPEGDTLIDFKPGQWLSLHLPVGGKAFLVRAYSLASASHGDGSLTLCFDRIEGGLGSEYLWTVEPGTSIEFSGPVGNFTLPDGDDPLVLVARYTGIVPFRAMLQSIERGSALRRPVHLVYEIPSKEERIYDDDLTTIAQSASWLDYHPIVADEGDALSVLAQYSAEWMPFIPMVCGTRDFTVPARAFFMETLGFERRQVKIENYNGPTAAA